MKVLGQILTFALLLGCVGPENIVVPFDVNEPPVEYGFHQKAFDLGMKNSRGVFFIRLQKKEGSFAATEIASVHLSPDNENEEILMFSSSFRAIFPAYFS
ncbi:MAG: hypothetical protein VST69_07710, partial [Nitrospirota bacterium]|nr:hypothetical protein [Nitrospirota bacterium]